MAGTTGNEARGKACRDLPSRAEVGARMECRELFWEEGQGLDNTCGKKGQKELFHLCVEVSFSLKSAKEQLSGSCCKVGKERSWTAPGQASLSWSTL